MRRTTSFRKLQSPDTGKCLPVRSPTQVCLLLASLFVAFGKASQIATLIVKKKTIFYQGKPQATINNY